jgi:hypothetical protein
VTDEAEQREVRRPNSAKTQLLVGKVGALVLQHSTVPVEKAGEQAPLVDRRRQLDPVVVVGVAGD